MKTTISLAKENKEWLDSLFDWGTINDKITQLRQRYEQLIKNEVRK